MGWRGFVSLLGGVVTQAFKIGVDGGGTKTESILVDASGEIVARHMSPGGNPSQVGAEKARELLVEALRALLRESKIEVQNFQIAATLLCMAGNRAYWAETAAALSATGEFGSVTACDDSRPVLELATDGAPGLVLHAGTGSFVAARAPDGAVHYAGGLGWKFGDPGSGFDLGRRASALALLELQSGLATTADARAPRSALAAALCAHTGIEDYTANSRFFYTDATANAQIAAFAPRVIELAAQDCGPAQQVVADSITDFARQADAVILRLFPHANRATPLPCGVSGKILNSEPARFVLHSLASKLNWPVTLQFIDTPPIEGVRRMLSKV